jgi:DNA-binding MarR family transcriptional regulator
MPQTPPLTGQDIAEAQGALRAVLDTALARTGTTSNGYVALRVLAVRGPIESPAAFHDYLTGQRQLGLDPQAATELLNDLESNGLISGSSPNDPGPVQLTDQGAALHTRLAESIVPVTKQVFADLDPDDLATARRVLIQLTEQANRVHAAL